MEVNKLDKKNNSNNEFKLTKSIDLKNNRNETTFKEFDNNKFKNNTKLKQSLTNNFKVINVIENLINKKIIQNVFDYLNNLFNSSNFKILLKIKESIKDICNNKNKDPITYLYLKKYIKTLELFKENISNIRNVNTFYINNACINDFKINNKIKFNNNNNNKNNLSLSDNQLSNEFRFDKFKSKTTKNSVVSQLSNNNSEINLNDSYNINDYEFNKIPNDNTSDENSFVENYYVKNNNSVTFEIPFKTRAVSERNNISKLNYINKLNHNFYNNNQENNHTVNTYLDNNTLLLKNKLKNKHLLINKNKLQLLRNGKDQMDKIRKKIKTIKLKKQEEQLKKRLRMEEKLLKFQKRQEMYINEKVNRARSEQIKSDEIAFLKKLEKSRKQHVLNKKLENSAIRRLKFLNERVLKCSTKKSINKSKSKIDNLYNFENNNSKKKDYSQLNLVFQKDFIWKLLETDYFEINDILKLNNLNKLEIFKLKIKKEAEEIENIINNRKNMLNNQINNNLKYCPLVISRNFYQEDFFNNYYKRSKSYSIFTESDLLDVNYLFNKDYSKKKAIKKKKKNKNNKLKLLRSISCLSLRNISNFDTKNNEIFNKINKSNCKYNNNTSNVNDINNYLELDNNVETKALCSINTDNNVDHNLYSKELINNSNIGINKEYTKANSYTIDNKISNESKTHSNSSSKSKSKNQYKINQYPFLNINDITNTLKELLNTNNVTIKLCRICNAVINSEIELNNHINSKDHKKLKAEYCLDKQDDNNLIIVFNSQLQNQNNSNSLNTSTNLINNKNMSISKDINDEVKNERLNSIKLKFKKLKQKVSLKALKHETFVSKSDYQSTNKQRILKICYDIEKLINNNSKDFETIEFSLKELIKILDQKKNTDLHLIRTQKLISFIFDFMKKPSICHKSEIKSLGKLLEVGIKVLNYFISIRENRNYFVLTNKVFVCVDLLLWVLNKPSKIPLGIGFLPDLVSLIIISLKHKLPYEYNAVKGDIVEYILYSNLLFKLKSKYDTVQGPADLISNVSSIPIFLLKSLNLIDVLIFQLYANQLLKPAYVISNNYTENINFILEGSDYIGLLQLLYTLLLYEGPYKSKTDKEGNTKLNYIPQTVSSASISCVKIINSIARLNLQRFQNFINNSAYYQEIIIHTFNYILSYSLDHLDNSDDTRELLHETILLIGYFCLLNKNLQNLLIKGEIPICQKLFSLPFSYFFDSKLKEVLIPTIISCTYNNETIVEILSKDLNLDIFVNYIKENINLKPIVEEDVNEETSIIEEKAVNISLDKSSTIENYINTVNNTDISKLKIKTEILSNISSTKSLHDMVNGVSDFLSFSFRFPRNLWEKAMYFYDKHN